MQQRAFMPISESGLYSQLPAPIPAAAPSMQEPPADLAGDPILLTKLACRGRRCR
jgi:hypothetical protein